MSWRSAEFDRPSGLPRVDDARSSDPVVRVTSLYATAWRVTGRTEAGQVADYLKLGVFAEHYERNARSVPQVALREEIDVSDLAFARWPEPSTLRGARLWLFVVPPYRLIVPALTFDIEVDLKNGGQIDPRALQRRSGLVELLQDVYERDLTVEGLDLGDYLRDRAGLIGADLGEDQGITTYQHQLVLGPGLPDRLGAAERASVVGALMYRTHAELSHDYTSVKYPMESNREKGVTVAVGPYMSIVLGWPQDGGNSAFISIVMVLAALAELSRISDEATATVAEIKDAQSPNVDPQKRQAVLERTADDLGDYQLLLTFNVDTLADISMLMPSQRVTNYHDVLVECMGLESKTKVVTKMLDRLDYAVRAEMAALTSFGSRMEEAQRKRWSIVQAGLSTVAVPVSIVFGYFGMNAAEVDERVSFLDLEKYGPLYLTISGSLAIGVIVFWAMKIYDEARLRKIYPGASRSWLRRVIGRRRQDAGRRPPRPRA
ncbi:hypothetical protein [Myceligenerans crystallogenes]|uniref:hypothetical protein n=1 Tax=Myceligenerans crystallogenes TaxID=316335 RepID=UPI0031DD0B7E